MRFSPHEPGAWQYRLEAQDASASAHTDPFSFVVSLSSSKGFIHTSQTDPRYFGFDNGLPFHATSLNDAAFLDNPGLNNEPRYQKFSQHGINFIRVWISGMYSASWLEWLGGRKIYDGYLPRAGTEAFHDSLSNHDSLTMVVDYKPGGDRGKR